MKKNVLYGTLLIALIGIFFNFAAPCAKAAAAERGDIGVISDIKIDDNAITIKSAKPFTYTLYSANDPYKVTLDIPDMTPGAFQNKIVSDKAGITEIIPHAHGTDAPRPYVKLEIILQNPSSVLPVYSDGVLTLHVKPEEPVMLAASNAAETAAKPEPAQKNETEKKAEPARDAGNVKESPKPEASASTENPAQKASAQEGPKDAAPEESGNASAPAVTAKATEVDRIELRKSFESLKVSIHGNGMLSPNVFPLDERVVIDIPGVSMHASMPSRFVSPLRGMRVGKYRDKVRIVLDLKHKTLFDVEAQGSVVTVSLKRNEPAAVKSSEGVVSEGISEDRPAHRASLVRTALAGHAELDRVKAVQAADENATPAADPAGTAVKQITSIPESNAGEQGKFKGKKISLDFQDAEIGPIFRLLADVNGFNLVLDPSVKGKITIKLMNVPWDQALDIILNTFNLSKSVDGNILWVAPSSVFSKIVDEKSKAREAEERSEELAQEIIRVNYASSSDLQNAISQGKLLSPRGSVTVDARMNTLIVKDTQKSIDKIKDLVKVMDVAKPQVMIEAKLVQVSNDYTEALGIRWGGAFTNPSWPTPIGGTFSVNTPTAPAGSAASVTGGAVGLTVGHANTMRVDLSLSALESVGKSKTLSNPKILTMDNEKATIQQGSTFYIATVSQAGTQTQAQSATLSLEVTPKITPDGYVQLKVTATDNSLVSVNPPVVDTKSMTTQALVKNGETLVLGGIYTSTKTEGEDRVPLLSQLPVLGWLFKTKNVKGPDIKELLIFITPVVITQQ